VLADEFDSHLIGIDEQVCDAWGRMSAIRPLSVPDALQAATAQVHEMTLVTRNTQHVANLGVPVLDPFT
jgi:toxin FitB